MGSSMYCRYLRASSGVFGNTARHFTFRFVASSTNCRYRPALELQYGQSFFRKNTRVFLFRAQSTLGIVTRSPALKLGILPLTCPDQTVRFTRTPAEITTAIAITTCAASSMLALTFARMLVHLVFRSVLCHDRPGRFLQNRSRNRERCISTHRFVLKALREFERTEQILMGQHTQHAREIKVRVRQSNKSSAVFGHDHRP